VTTMVAVPGIYVIEVQHGVVKVGLSGDTERRISTHLRNARGLGADPYRWLVIDCPNHLLREAERAAHAAVRGIGGTPQARTPEVFTDVYFNPAWEAARGAVAVVVETDAALARLRALDVSRFEQLMVTLPGDVALVVASVVQP